VADEDGVIAVQPHRAEEVLDAARALHLKHQSAQPILLRGEVTDIENIHQRAVSRGGAFFDKPFSAPSNEGTSQD
jgi:regulator of RNase E activity RraA